MMDPRVATLITLMQAVRGVLRALDQSIVTVLDFLKEDIDAQPEEKHMTEGANVCHHPPQARRPTPAMGHATRYYCTVCGETVE
jgi:hypothetical protein